MSNCTIINEILATLFILSAAGFMTALSLFVYTKDKLDNLRKESLEDKVQLTNIRMRFRKML